MIENARAKASGTTLRLYPERSITHACSRGLFEFELERQRAESFIA
jgi:hypothetical protein